MRILIKDCQIKDKTSPFHNKEADVLIENGFIVDISSNIQTESDSLINAKGKMLVPSFIDMGCFISDPGNEANETIETALRAGASSGFSTLCMYPNTDPCIDNKGQVEYVLSRSLAQMGKVLPFGAVSKGCKGLEMSEMLDLHSVGVLGFSDGDKPIVNSELLLKSLEYTSKFGGVVINRPLDIYLSEFGHMHEGEVSTNLGLLGVPSLAEQIMVQRDISILRYAGGRLHLSAISTKESVELVRAAKAEGLELTADVAISNLLFTDKDVEDFDTNFKLNPPLREAKDRDALIEGVIDGTIDAIISNHNPKDQESKKLEFDLADDGTTVLQTFLPMLIELSDKIDIDILFDKVSMSPGLILALPSYSVNIDEKANLALLDPKYQWNLNNESNLSRSDNTPYFNKDLAGICDFIMHDGVAVFREND